MLERLRKLAADSWNLLIGATCVEDCTRSEYQKRLRAAGLVLTHDALDLQRVRAAVRDYWGGCLDLWPKLKRLDAARGTWVDYLLHSPHHKPSLNHLLFRGWLDSLPLAEQIEPPFGEGPWVCVNPLAEHNGRPVVTRFERRYLERGILGGRFTCDCGFVYTRRRTAKGETSAPRPWEYGPLAAQMIREYRDAGRSIYAMAERLGVWPNTIAIIAATNGIELSRRPPKSWRDGAKRRDTSKELGAWDRGSD